MRLRDDIRLDREDGVPVLLDDPILGRRIELGGAMGALIAVLDGRPLDELAAALPALRRDQVEGLARRLLLLGLVEGASAETVARLRALRRGEARLERTSLPGAVFGCQGSGDCCHGRRLGPLTDEDIARLDGLDLEAEFPGPHVVELRRDDGSVGRYLRQVDHHCHFQLADGRCGVHARFGAAAKPGMCRLFPLDQQATIRGIRVYDRGSCSTFAVSARTGLPVVNEVQGLLPEAPEIFHPVVQVGRIMFDYGYFLQFTDFGIALSEKRVATAAETLRAIGRRLQELVGELQLCPLEPGEPDATVADVLAREPWLDATPAPVEDKGVEAYVAVVEALGKALEDEVMQATMGSRRLADMAALLAVMGARGDALSLAPEVDEVLHLSLRQHLFGAHSLIGNLPVPALLRTALVMAAAVHGGRARAARRGATRVEATDLSASHSAMARLLDVADHLMVQAGAVAPLILESLPAILGLQGAVS